MQILRKSILLKVLSEKLNTKNYIVKNERISPAEDYAFLRKQGLEYIEKLSGKIWTDFNVHDPGITILEMLCYAITDISYRTSFNIKDLLVSQKDQGGIKDLFTARQILTCNPVTIDDFRKILIDVDGIRNAWLHIAGKQEQDIYIDCKKSELVFDKKPGFREIRLDGLYEVTLELDDDVILGDLNDYTFKEIHDDIAYTFCFPGWDFFHKHKIDPLNLEFEKYEYIQYISGTKVHEAKITLSSDSVSKKRILPVTFVLAGQRKIENENKIKSFLSSGGAKALYQKYASKIHEALKIVDKARTRLMQHRNLCEDFKSFKPVDIEEIALCANIIVTPDAEIEKIYARILFEIGSFLAPGIQFYSLKDLLNESMAVDEIFEGPVLDHGFIKNDELTKSELPKEIHISDFINIIMDIEGVQAIEKIQIGSYYQGVVQFTGEKWTLPLGEGRAPRLRADLADLTFYKGLIPYDSFNQEKIDLYYNELIQSVRTSKLKKDEYDFPVPEGKYLDIADYVSIQEDFPLVYGIGKKGIPGIVDQNRKARAKQLKAFLSLFDQLLANYLAQLRNLKELFSYGNDVTRTYFYQLPYNIPDMENEEVLFMKDEIPEIYKLLKEFTQTLSPGTNIDDFKSYASYWDSFRKDKNNHFVQHLASYIENKATFEDRRNRFLDHLMSRFAEQFTDYVLLMYQMKGSKAAEELINDKSAFLRDYVEISSSRGKAYNYSQCKDIWSTETDIGSNVAGYVKRLSRLTGIDNYLRRSLSCSDISPKSTIFIGTDNQWYFHFGTIGNVLLRSEGYKEKRNCQKGINSVIENGVDLANYELKTAIDKTFYYNLKAKNGKIIGTSPMFQSEEERNEKLNKLMEMLGAKCDTEGFHLIEHILLRPSDSSYDLMTVCVDPGCKSCLGFQDPYTFRMTLILPAWVERFRNIEFRRFFENTARMEAPAHTHIKCCWISKNDMEIFELAYKNWLYALCEDKMTPSIQNKLTKILSEIKSVYPEGVLHDCAEDAGENPLILGITNIGSSKTE